MKQEISKMDMERAILHAAKELFLSEGFKNTSMRKIAAKLGVSPTTLYLYYKDKADIIHALHQYGFRILSEQFRTLENVRNPFERLKAMGRCYMSFAIENKDLYEIMFVREEPLEHVLNMSDDDPAWQEGREAYEKLMVTVKECVEMGYFKDYDVEVLALLIWSNMHGLCALSIKGHLSLAIKKLKGDVELSELLQRSFDMYVKMLENI